VPVKVRNLAPHNSNLYAKNLGIFFKTTVLARRSRHQLSRAKASQCKDQIGLAGGVGRRQPVVQVLKPSGQHAVLPQSSAEKRIMHIFRPLSREEFSAADTEPASREPGAPAKQLYYERWLIA